MAPCQIAHMDIVAHTGAVRRRVVGAVDGDLRAQAGCGLQHQRDQLSFRIVPLTGPALLADDPASWLGPEAGDTLPYLLKILAAARPLSIQVHPTRAQARDGFEREEAAGIDRGAPQRSYRDRNHKPEILVALRAEDLS